MKKIIKHKTLLNPDTDRFYYLCNQACNTTDEKTILGTWKGVTCKNCLKQKPVNTKKVKIK